MKSIGSRAKNRHSHHVLLTARIFQYNEFINKFRIGYELKAKMNTAKVSQVKIAQLSKRPGPRFWLSCLAIILVMPLLLYYGYCWGWWGRHNLLLQYLFQCNCPTASQEARYPDSVDVIVPACTYEYAMLSPSGRLLSVREKDTGATSTYLLDLQTSEKIRFPLPENSGFYFLTDNLLYVSVSSGAEVYILDRTTGTQYPIQEFRTLLPNAYVQGDANLELLAEALRKAKYVFYRDYDGRIIALDPNFPSSGTDNFTIDRFGIPGDDLNRVEQFLIKNNITYQTILPDFPKQVVSQDGRFVARPDGIYLVKTGQKIVEGYSASNSIRGYSGHYFFARGWTDNGQAVIYSELLNPCLIETTFFIFDEYSCYFEVPQPVIKIKVPEEYLRHSQSP